MKNGLAEFKTKLELIISHFKHPNSKITEKEVDDAVRLWAHGDSLSQIIKKLGLPVRKTSLHERLVSAITKYEKKASIGAV